MAVKYSPKEFPYARPIASALIGDPTFREWFLQDTPFGKVAGQAEALCDEQAALRTTQSSRRWFWFNVFCTLDGACMCRGEDTGIETDIFLVLRLPDASRLALHVEVKRPGDDLSPGQEMAYSRRAACWLQEETRPRTVPPHDMAITALVCDAALASDPRAKRFCATVRHDEIAARLSPYPDLTDLRYA